MNYLQKRLSILAIIFFFNNTAIAQWDSLGTGLASGARITVLAGRTVLLAGTEGSGIYGSTDDGITWSALNTGLPLNDTVKSIANQPLGTFASVWSNGIFRSTDNGQNWNSVNTGLTNLNYNNVYAFDHYIFSASEGSGIFRLDVTDETTISTGWITKSTGLPANAKVRFLTSKDLNLFAALNGKGVYKSTDNGDTWSAINSGIAVADTFAQTLWAKSGTTQIYLGINQVGFGGTGKLYRSDNDGSSWIQLTGIGSGLNADPRSWMVDGSTVFVGSDAKYAGGVRGSTNNGTSWTDLNTGNLNKKDVNALFKFGSYLFAGTKANGVWRRLVSEMLPVELVSFTAVCRSTIVNLKWNTATETNNYGFEIERRTTPVSPPLHGGDVSGGWRKIGFIEGSGTTNTPKEYSFTVNNTFSGKYFYRLKQIDRDGKFNYSQEVEAFVDVTPKDFLLTQNYPNPFNPTTVISYQIPTTNHVSLKVFDALGREVAILVNSEKTAGAYFASFDASHISSGIYFYSLSSGDYYSVRKMLILK